MIVQFAPRTSLPIPQTFHQTGEKPQCGLSELIPADRQHMAGQASTCQTAKICLLCSDVGGLTGFSPCKQKFLYPYGNLIFMQLIQCFQIL